MPPRRRRRHVVKKRLRGLQEYALTDRKKSGMAEAIANPASMWRRARTTEEGSSRAKPNDDAYDVVEVALNGYG